MGVIKDRPFELFFQSIFLNSDTVKVYKEHIKTVAEATRLNQELHKAKKEEVEAEEGLLRSTTIMMIINIKKGKCLW